MSAPSHLQMKIEQNGTAEKTGNNQFYASLLQWHGLADIFASQTKRQALSWAIIVAIALAGLILEVQNVFSEYMEQPFVIVTDPVYLSSQRIPDTVICPTDPLNTTKLRSANFSEFEIAQLHAVFTPDWYTVPSGWYVAKESRFDLEGKVQAMNLDWKEFLFKFGMDCPAVLTHCMINWRIMDCCNMVENVLHRYFGKCFAFKDLDRYNNQTAAFLFGGLVILANNNRMPTQDLYGNILHGLAVEISHKYTGQNTYQILPVTPNEVTEITLEAEKRIRHPSRQGGCLQLKNWDSKMTPHYCWNKGVTTVCNCSLAGYATSLDMSNEEIPLCFPKDFSECPNSQIQAVADQCYKELARPTCEEWHYRPTILRSKLDLERNYYYTQSVYNFPKVLNSTELLNPNNTYSMINVYFSQMGYTTIKETSTFSIHRFVSSIGGHLSLFLGASLISIVQLVVYLPSVCLKRKTSVNVSSTTERLFVSPATPEENEKKKSATEDSFSIRIRSVSSVENKPAPTDGLSTGVGLPPVGE